jgi:radical SAM superfamily enzyme YgiQ (UPF0313 family)
MKPMRLIARLRYAEASMPSVLLISTYDLGRQPFGLASATAALRAAGAEVTCADLSRDRLAPEQVAAARLVGFFLPMHTATRLAVPVIARVRELNPEARLCAFGLYAPLNVKLLRELGVEHILGGEFEDDLQRLAAGAAVGEVDTALVPRVTFRVPERDGLPALSRYATLRIGPDTKVVGYTEASRGCKHTCRHCPIVPVYDGRFRIVPIDVVMADVRAQVAAGAGHITFGDPDFFNGIRHAIAVVHAFHGEFPDLSYDVTIKIEHLLDHAGRLPELTGTGCAFVTSAVESVDDGILERLAKGHTLADFERAVGLCRDAGLSLSPTFVAFTPWTTLAGYCALLQTIDRLGLVEQVAPIQLAIRLLVTAGSRLLDLPDIVRLAPVFDAGTMTYPWRHADPEVDRLHALVAGIAGDRGSDSRGETFDRIWRPAHAAAGLTPPVRARVIPSPAPIAYMSEPWYCCAEPTPAQEALI